VPTLNRASAGIRFGACRRRFQGTTIAVLVALLVSSVAQAQNAPGTWRVAEGRVLRALGDTSVALPNQWVTLHRVGPDTAAPLDSVQTDARGKFDFRYQLSGSRDAIYFASSTHGGIAYFTPPLTGATTERGALELVVFDTSSVSRPLSVRGRHVIVGAPAPSGGRTVIEVFEISNDSSVTLVAGPGDAPTFTAMVPRTASAFQVRESDVAKDAITLRDGRVEVRAPIAPGLRQIAFSYEMPKRAKALRFPVERPTPVLEVLAEEPLARIGGGAVTEVDPVTIDGRGFRRYLAQDPPPAGVVTMEFPATPTATRQLYLAVVIVAVGAAMLAALARAAMRRR